MVRTCSARITESRERPDSDAGTATWAGNWNRDQKPLNLKSKMLNKQTVCVLGFGNIGSRIGKLIAAFGAKVIAVDGKAKAGEIASEVYKNERDQGSGK